MMKVFALKISLIILLLVFGIRISPAIDTSSIEAMWLFDDGAGNVLQDSSGNNRHGAIEGDAKWTNDGKFGGALEFDGVDDEVVITGYKGIGGNNPRTTVLWFRTTEQRSHRLVCWGANANTNKYHIRTHDGPRTLRIETQGGQLYSTTTEVTDGNWHHLAVVLPAGSTMCHDHRLYVDGELQESTAGTDVGVDTEVTQNDVEIGYDKVIKNTDYTKGTIDEVAIFNVALNEDDIKNIMLEGLSGSVLSVSSNNKLANTWGDLKQ
jgi:hypothetical protein